jgi:hypothetical protein
MALNINTQDLDNYPGNTQRVTVDLDSLVPVGFEGDEQFIMVASTSAYSDSVARTSIQDLQIMDFKTGWCKSSGFAGSGGKFMLDSTHYKMKVKVDATVSGSDGSGWYTIDLAYNSDGTPVTGEAIAEDMERKIRDISDNLNVADTGFKLAYLNSSVYFQQGKFWIVSGSIGKYYTGEYRSSVKVAAGDTNDATVRLGFDVAVDTQTLATITINETKLTLNYATNTSTMAIMGGSGVKEGDCLMITDGTNTDYFTALAGTTDLSIAVPTSSVNSYIGVKHSYTVSGTKLQILREQDPDNEPTGWYKSIDQLAVVIPNSIARLNRFLLDYSFPDMIATRERGVMEFIPPQMMADIRIVNEDDALNGFTQGMRVGEKSISFSKIPWQAWKRTLWFWIPVILSLWFCLVALAVVVHRQWSDHEQLAYPIANVANATRRSTTPIIVFIMDSPQFLMEYNKKWVNLPLKKNITIKI